VSCEDKTCIAGGSYTDNDNGNTFPLLIESSDCGNDWDYVIDETNTPSNFDIGNGNSSQGSVNAVSCGNGLCIASGYYRSTTDGTYFPFLATPIDDTWDYQIEDTGPLPSHFYQSNDGFIGAGTTH
jgi:hypothetical protein